MPLIRSRIELRHMDVNHSAVTTLLEGARSTSGGRLRLGQTAWTRGSVTLGSAGHFGVNYLMHSCSNFGLIFSSHSDMSIPRCGVRGAKIFIRLIPSGRWSPLAQF